jgi:integrase
LAKLSIKITHVAWRGGRPRFQPGPKLRRLGFKGEDLRHSPDGSYLTADEALTWSRSKEAEIAARRQQAAAARQSRKKLPALTAPTGASIAGHRLPAGLLSIEALFELYFATPRLQGIEIVEGKRKVRPLSPATIADYKKKRDALARFDGTLYVAPVDALTDVIVFNLYERMHEGLGLSSARGAIAVLSAAISWGKRRGKVTLRENLGRNPCKDLGMETPEARVRAGSVEEIRLFTAIADLAGYPEIGDAISLGVWTGQRQKDRLELIDAGLYDGRRRFRQSKTGAIVELREAPELAARLAAARARRTEWRVQPLQVIVNERSGAPFKADYYRHVFAQVRDIAAFFMPSLADFRDQDLRDTAVTWLARAGCTPIEIAQITGHSLASIQDILKHYLASHREIGDNAIRKVLAWYEAGASG